MTSPKRSHPDMPVIRAAPGMALSTVALLLEFYDFKCAYCGTELTESVGYQFDHVVPISAGGDDGPLNLAPACPYCNGSKNARDYAAWMAGQGLDVEAFERRRAELAASVNDALSAPPYPKLRGKRGPRPPAPVVHELPPSPQSNPYFRRAGQALRNIAANKAAADAANRASVKKTELLARRAEQARMRRARKRGETAEVAK